MRANHPEVNIPVSAEQESGSLLESFPYIAPISPLPFESPEDEAFIDELVSTGIQIPPAPEATSTELQLSNTTEQQLSTHSEQQPPLLATSTPPIGNQSAIANILTPSPRILPHL